MFAPGRRRLGGWSSLAGGVVVTGRRLGRVAPSGFRRSGNAGGSPVRAWAVAGCAPPGWVAAAALPRAASVCTQPASATAACGRVRLVVSDASRMATRSGTGSPWLARNGPSRAVGWSAEQDRTDPTVAVGCRNGFKTIRNARAGHGFCCTVEP